MSTQTDILETLKARVREAGVSPVTENRNPLFQKLIAKARRDGARFTSVMPEGETTKKTYEERIAALEARLALLESQNK